MTPATLVNRYLTRRTREDALMAAYILRRYPEFPGGKRVGKWLGLIGSGSIPQEQVDEWLRSPMHNRHPFQIDWGKRISALKWWEREALADVLERWARSTR
jgi:hypothetical protein